MMPEEWPIAASAADENAPAPMAGRGRLWTVRRDFFLDPKKRLTEQERALMTAMLHCLVGAAEKNGHQARLIEHPGRRQCRHQRCVAFVIGGEPAIGQRGP